MRIVGAGSRGGGFLNGPCPGTAPASSRGPTASVGAPVITSDRLRSRPTSPGVRPPVDRTPWNGAGGSDHR